MTLWLRNQRGAIATSGAAKGPDPTLAWGIFALDDFVLVKADGFGTFNLQEYTIAHWVKPLVDLNYVILWSYDYTSHAAPFYKQAQQIRIGGECQAYFESSGFSIKVVTGTGLYNKWNHFVTTYKAGEQKLYLNGVEIGSNTFAGPVGIYQNQEVWIGKSNFTSGDAQPMHMADSRFYSRAWTSEELTEAYKNYLPPTDALVMHYDYAGQVNDQSGSGNHAVSFSGTYGP